MTVQELRDELENVPDDAIVVFQGNDSENPTYTTCTGTLFEAFYRNEPSAFVLDCIVEDQESR